ncbi:NADPH-flavin oxidoreductase [Planctomycetes bacterium Poly30]|uniref:NADPH-flavin oxidoreductase n=1 Tax=Saltatorellus ferox TaxID=2528018 RepID=A0A518EQK8_9BACT|nr:NADPH-flavin oxidoreductase [Planctomycetes bacterium Poly30]
MAAEPTSDPHGDPEKDASGIPDAPAGNRTFDASAADDGSSRPLHDLPDVNFWDVLYGRRSIRKFEDRPVDRALIEQVMHAGIWAPSSCNYQMWDLVAVTDPGINGQLAALSTQMANAPVNVIISYGRDFSEEAWANIQSASALIQNMSLAAHALGLGTFWITQTGGAEKVREAVGLPYDRIVIAVLALGWPKVIPKRGPKRRPLDQVTHFEHYAGRPIPSSTNPSDWDADLLAIYQRARVLNGLRHNKPRAWEQRALVDALDALLPDGKEKPAEGEARQRWLDVLPCTGILTAKLGTIRKGFAFDVVERSLEVAEFCANRVSPRGQALAWPTSTDTDAAETFPAPTPDTYDVVSCFFRLEGLRPEHRADLVRAMASWLKPGGRLLLGYVNARSFHGLTEALRARGSGPKGVEYVLSPDPNIGPFEALTPKSVDSLLQEAGGTVEARFRAQAAPAPEEVDFRTRNMQGLSGKAIRTAASVARMADKIPALSQGRSRFQFLCIRFP